MAPRIQIEMTANEARAWAGMQKLIVQQTTLQNGLKNTGMQAGAAGAKMRSAGTAGRTAFGAGAVAQIRSYAASFLGIGAAITQVIGLFNDMREARQEATQQWGQAEGGMSELAQLAKTPEAFQALTARARKVYGAGGGDSLESAAKLVFQLESAGASEFEDLFTQLSSKRLVTDPAVMAKAAATLQTTMGKGETGTMRALASKAFGASLYSPATADALLEAAARSGSSAAAMGITDEEVLAATAVVATGKGGAEMGGTYLAQLMRTLRQKGIFKGQDLATTLGQVERITGGMSEEDAKEWFGRAQGREAFDILRTNMPRYGKAFAEVQAAQQEDRVAAQLKLSESDPTIYASQRARIAKAQEELSKETLGQMGNLADTVLDEFATQARREGRGEFGIGLTRRYAGLQRYFGGDEWWLRQAHDDIADPRTRREVAELAGTGHRFVGGGGPAGGDGGLIEAAKNLNAAAETLRDAGRGPTLVPPNVDR